MKKVFAFLAFLFFIGTHNASAATLPVTQGGTGLTTFRRGDLIYIPSAISPAVPGVNTLARLASGSEGTCLMTTSGVPAWGNCAFDTTADYNLTGHWNFQNSASVSPTFEIGETVTDGSGTLKLSSTLTSDTRSAILNYDYSSGLSIYDPNGTPITIAGGPAPSEVTFGNSVHIGDGKYIYGDGTLNISTVGTLNIQAGGGASPIDISGSDLSFLTNTVRFFGQNDCDALNTNGSGIVGCDTSGPWLPLSGGTETGLVTFQAGASFSPSIEVTGTASISSSLNVGNGTTGTINVFRSGGTMFCLSRSVNCGTPILNVGTSSNHPVFSMFRSDGTTRTVRFDSNLRQYSFEGAATVMIGNVQGTQSPDFTLDVTAASNPSIGVSGSGNATLTLKGFPSGSPNVTDGSFSLLASGAAGCDCFIVKNGVGNILTVTASSGQMVLNPPSTGFETSTGTLNIFPKDTSAETAIVLQRKTGDNIGGSLYITEGNSTPGTGGLRLRYDGSNNEGNLTVGNPSVAGNSRPQLNIERDTPGININTTTSQNAAVGIVGDQPLIRASSTALMFIVSEDGELGVAGVGQFAGVATAQYSRFGSNATNHGLSLPNDLLVSDMFEVDDGAFFDSFASVSLNLEVGGYASASKMFGVLNWTTATGTPGTVCYNTTTGEALKNNALTCTVSARDQKTHIGSFFDDQIVGGHISAIDLVNKLEPTEFAYKDQPNRLRWGFIAEQVAEVDPKLGDGYIGNDARSLDQNALIALNTKAIQELSDLVNGKTVISVPSKEVPRTSWTTGVLVVVFSCYVFWNEWDKRRIKAKIHA